MAEAQRLLNPWVLHLQKLGLELKCPLCLQLFDRPMLLPCNHIFCNFCIPKKSTQFGSECPACKHQYVDPDVKPAPFMENIVAIYRNIDATFSANLIQPVCSDGGPVTKRSTSFKTNANDISRKEDAEIPQEGNSSNSRATTSQPAVSTPLNVSAGNLFASNFDKCTTPESSQKQEFRMACSGDKSNPPNYMCQVVAEKHTQTEGEEIGFLQLEQLSPPQSSGSKDMDGNCSDPSSSHGNAVRCPAKRPAENVSCRTGLESTSKKQKKMSNGLNDMGVKINIHPQSKTMPCESLATPGHTVETNLAKPLSCGQSTLCLDPLDSKRGPCAFCHSAKETEGSGPLLSYASGKEVVGNVANHSKVIHVHEKCIGWTPRIYFEDGIIKNLESEIARANKLKCSSCGKKGAGLGCYVGSCSKTYHVPCAYDIFDCRWDCDDYLLLCPKHESVKFPSERKLKPGKQDTENRISAQLNPCSVSTAGKNFVLCGSALSSEEKCRLVEFARTCGITVSKYWRPNVTHVIAATDADGACTRTLKVLMAILNGKWILTMEWVKACVEAGHIVNEEQYEVSLDNHGCSGGPKAGRLRVLDNAPNLFNGLNFYFSGDFVQAFKNDLINLVIAGGGIVFENKDQLLASSNGVRLIPMTLVVYNADLSVHSMYEDEESIKFQRVAVAKDVARETGSHVVGHTWILESIATCSLLPMTSGA